MQNILSAGSGSWRRRKALTACGFDKRSSRITGKGLIIVTGSTAKPNNTGLRCGRYALGFCQHFDQTLYSSPLYTNFSKGELLQSSVCSDGPRRFFRNWHCSYAVSIVPAFCKGVEPNASRNMRRFYQISYCHWCHQHVYRHYYHPAADANSMASTNERQAKNRTYHDFRTWHNVRFTRNQRQPCSDSNLTVLLSIVVVTIFRVITATQDRVDDFTYGLAKLAICTDLEPLLGMINACMPVLQPALRRVLHTERSRSSPSRKVAFPGSTTKLNSDNKSKGSKFRQIEDSYMLTDTTGTTNTYVGTASRPNSIGDEESLSAPPAITVQREWEVVSGK